MEDEYARTVAYLIWMELFRVGKTVVAPVRAAFIVECMRTIAWPDFGASWKEKQAAIKAMKFYGRQSADHAKQMLSGFDDFPEFMKTPQSGCQIRTRFVPGGYLLYFGQRDTEVQLIVDTLFAHAGGYDTVHCHAQLGTYFF